MADSNFGRSYTTITEEELKVMKMHATGRADKLYTDYYKDGDYSGILIEVEARVPHTSKGKVTDLSCEFTTISSGFSETKTAFSDMPILAPEPTFWSKFKLGFKTLLIYLSLRFK